MRRIVLTNLFFLCFVCFLFSNPIYAEVDIEPCTSTPFNCLMICNPDLNYSPTENCVPMYPTIWGDGLDWRENVFYAPTPDDTMPDVDCTDFEGWASIFGSPDYSETLACPGGDGQIRMWAEHTPAANEVEGIVTDVVIEGGKKYIVTYLRKIQFCTGGGGDGSANKTGDDGIEVSTNKNTSNAKSLPPCSNGADDLDMVQVKLTNDAEITWALDDDEFELADGGADFQAVYPLDENLSNDVSWVRHVRCFEAEKNWNRLYIHPEQNLGNGLIFLQVDDVELMSADFVPAAESLSIECSETPIWIGDPLCNEMTDLVTTWQSTTDLTGSSGWVDLPEYDGETWIEVSPTESTLYRACRQFLSPENYKVIGEISCAESCMDIVVEVAEWDCCLEAIDEFDVDATGFTATTNATWSDGSNEIGNAVSPVLVDGDLVIPSGVNITIDDMEFQFTPNGRIIVENGANLRIIDGKYTSVCETMWPGIQVHGHGMSVPQDFSSGFLYVEGAIIENAVVGIATWAVPLFNFASMGITSTPDFNLYLNTPSLTLDGLGIGPAISTGGGRIEVTGGTGSPTRFFNCFHGINDSYHRPSSVNRINNSIFSASADLLYPFDALNIQTEAGIFSLLKGSIAGSTNGIHSCQFRNPKYGISANEITHQRIVDNTFNGCTVGISSNNVVTESSQAFTIDANHFDACNVAVQCNATWLTIHYNMVNQSTTLPNYPTGSLAYGFYLRDSFQSLVLSNEINETHAGMILTDTPMVEGETVVIDNDISRSMIAFIAEGDNTALRILCNRFSYFIRGIDIRQWLTTGDNGDLGQQGDCPDSEPAGNTFTPISSGIADIYMGVNTNDFTYHEQNATALNVFFAPGATSIYNPVNCTPGEPNLCTPFGGEEGGKADSDVKEMISKEKASNKSFKWDKAIQISPLYPNPATSTTSFNYQLGEGQTLTLNVYDINGRLVEATELKGIGKHQLNVSNYSQGLHICTFSVNGEVLSREKLMITK